MRPDEISMQQLWVVVFGVLLVAAFYAFPRSAIEATATAAPWAILLAGSVAVLMLWPTVRALSRRPGQNLTDLALQAGGRPLAVASSLVLISIILTAVGFSLRQSSELVVTALYPHTPQTFAMTTTILVAALGAAMAPANLFWMAALTSWAIAFSILLLLLGTVGWGQLRNATPVTGHGILPTLREILPLTSYYTPLLHLLIFCRFLPTPRGLLRGTLLATGGATLMWAVVLLFSLMVFPLPVGLHVPFPVYEMSRIVQGGRFLERVDTIWIVVWAFGSVLRTAVAIMAAARLFQEAFRLPDHRGAVLPLTIPTLAIALIPANQADAITLESEIFRRISFVALFLLPAGISLWAEFRARQRRGETPGGGGGGTG